MEFLLVIFAFIFGTWVGEFGNEPDFIKDHHKSPYCITKEVGAETIKKCYIATEVK